MTEYWKRDSTAKLEERVAGVLAELMSGVAVPGAGNLLHFALSVGTDADTVERVACREG